MSKCYGALKLMKDDYSEYTHSQGRDHDELSRRLDVVNNHWMWLKRIVNRYENQHKSIASQTDKLMTVSYILPHCISTAGMLL